MTPLRRKTHKPAATTSAEPAPSPQPSPAKPIKHQAASHPAMTPELPPLDAPSVNARDPEISYKIDYQDRDQWYISSDRGATKTPSGSDIVVGVPLDLVLEIAEARKHDGIDYRLRLAFNRIGDVGGVCELNLNACNISKRGDAYVTSPTRSLIGALLAICESEDDIEAFMHGSRFVLTPGSGRGVFIGVEVPNMSRGSWVAMGDAMATRQASDDPIQMMSQLAHIKRVLRSQGHLLTERSVCGELSLIERDFDNFEAVPVSAEQVPPGDGLPEDIAF